MMQTSTEQRQERRVTAFGPIYRKRTTWGYSINISETGMKIWINEDDIPTDFQIGIKHPDKLAAKPVSFDVEKVWVKPQKSKQLIEVGCQFKNLSEQQQDYLKTLIEYYETERMDQVLI